jgi:hypothetical protein
MNFEGANKKMKRIFLYVGLAAAMLAATGCMKKKSSEPTHFSTPQEAANKAKSDLLEVLRSRKEIALGLDEQTIEKSQPGTPVRQFQVTFEDLLSANTFASLARNELATVVPLVADGTVATVAEVAKADSGWKVASLADKSLSSELDIVQKAAGPQAQIIIYDLPHSGVKVYGVTQPLTAGAGNALYTSYPGFNLREAVPDDRLLAVLKQDAAEFQRTYGEELKGRKVVR